MVTTRCFEADKYEISIHAFIEFVECERSVILFLIVSVLFLLIQIFGIQRVQLYHTDLIVPFKYLGKQLLEGDKHVITFFLIFIENFFFFIIFQNKYKFIFLLINDQRI